MSNGNNTELDDIRRRLLKLEGIFDTINKLTIQIEKLALETKYMREDYNDINSRVMILEQKPVKRYDTAITAIITGLIGIVIGVITAILK